MKQFLREHIESLSVESYKLSINNFFIIYASSNQYRLGYCEGFYCVMISNDIVYKSSTAFAALERYKELLIENAS